MPHLVKFLEKEYDKNKQGVFVIRRKVIPPKYYVPPQVRYYFQHPPEGHVYIKVSTNDSKLYKLYAWIQHIDEHFSQLMTDYVSVRFDLQRVSDSIREFLALYEITESEYSYETAYKRWQRSRKYQSLRKRKDKKCRESARQQEITTED